jgi:hypothetical protein
MSLLLAVRDDQDIVIASDGRVLGEDSGVLSNDSLKTLALNSRLCLGLAGSTDTMSLVLRAFGIRCRGSHPIDLLGVCQEVACPIDVDYADARDELSSLYRWVARRVPVRSRSARRPVVILAGEASGDPALCEWHPPARAMEAVGSAGYSEAIAGSLPDEGTEAWREFGRMVRAERSTREAEERLTRAIRFCARSFGATGPISETVHLRRLTKGFELMQAAPAYG